MSDHSAFRTAALQAKAQAERKGLIIDWASWRNGSLEWHGIPKKEAKAAAQGEGEFQPKAKRGMAQGSLL